jgi:hypothetical protein
MAQGTETISTIPLSLNRWAMKAGKCCGGAPLFFAGVARVSEWRS